MAAGVLPWLSALVKGKSTLSFLGLMSQLGHYILLVANTPDDVPVSWTSGWAGRVY